MRLFSLGKKGEEGGDAMERSHSLAWLIIILVFVAIIIYILSKRAGIMRIP
jgi:hypothetical protein